MAAAAAIERRRRRKKGQFLSVIFIFCAVVVFVFV
jgi:hypothetical protein